MGPHVDGHRRLSLVLAGSVSEKGAHREVHATAGSVGLKAACFGHQTRFGDAGATVLSVLLPDELLAHLGSSAALAAGRWRDSDTATLAAMRLALALGREDPAGAAHALRALLPEFLAAGSPARHVPARIGRIVADLEAFMPLPVEELADRERVHPVVLGRQFRQALGCSITAYRQRRRVARVARALAGGRDALVDVALDHGFSDLSHMTRVFRRELEAPPGEFRSALGMGHERLDSFKTEWRLRV
jgi:AraC-like DNA-binding protein